PVDVAWRDEALADVEVRHIDAAGRKAAGINIKSGIQTIHRGLIVTRNNGDATEPITGSHVVGGECLRHAAPSTRPACSRWEKSGRDGDIAEIAGVIAAIF